MNLNKEKRKDIHDAIMGDVPSVDYVTLKQDKAVSVAVNLLPPKVRELWDNVETRGWVHTESIYVQSRWENVGADWVRIPTLEVSCEEVPGLYAAMQEVNRVQSAQRSAREELSRPLKAALEGCSTAAQFRSRYPEFAKYAEEGAKKIENLPASNSLRNAFICAGWPGAGKGE